MITLSNGEKIGTLLFIINLVSSAVLQQYKLSKIPLATTVEEAMVVLESELT